MTTIFSDASSTGYEPLYTLKPVAPSVWIADGGWIRFYGLPFPTRMTIVRLRSGGIWLHSPIVDKNGLSRAVAELGPVRHLIAPNWIHYSWVPDWQMRFEDAITWGSPGVVARAATQGLTLRIDHELGDASPEDWRGDLDQRLAISRLHQEVVFFHRDSRTLVLTDLVENFELSKMPWWTRPILRFGGVCDPDGRMPRDIAASFGRETAHTRELIQTMIGWEPERVIIAHGRWYDRDGTAELQRAFRRLM